MRRIKIVIVVLAGFLVMGAFLGLGHAKADDNAVMQSDNQVIKDEGYGNSDEEYYNSEDDRVNDEEASDAQENTSANAQ